MESCNSYEGLMIPGVSETKTIMAIKTIKENGTFQIPTKNNKES